MELNLFKNIKNNKESNSDTRNFISELSNFLNKNNNENLSENSEDVQIEQELNTELDENIDNYRKEGHLYLVTEDRDNIVYLWDFTEKSKESFEEDNLPPELIGVATEGAMLQYINGKYELYSENGYDMVYGEEDE